MTPMHTFLHSRQVETIAVTLLHFLWQAMAIAACLALLLHAARRGSAHLRYLIAVAALLLMMMCPIVTAALISRVPDAVQDANRGIARTGAVADRPGGTGSSVEATHSTLHSDIHSPPRPPGGFSAAIRHAAPLIFAVWICGLVLLSIRMLGGWMLAQRMAVRASEPHNASLEQTFARLADRMRVTRLPQLIVSSTAPSPFLLGAYRTTVVLPVGLLSGLTPPMVEAILLHELAHVRRHDYLVNLAQCFVETVLFFHPAVWWASARIRDEREYCCDDLVIATLNDRSIYARALAGLAALRAEPLTIAANGGALLVRIHRILGVTMMQKDNRSLFTPAVAALALAAVCGAGCLQAETRLGTEAADRVTPSTFAMRTETVLSDPASNRNGAASTFYHVEIGLTRRAIDGAGRLKDTQISWYKLAVSPGTGKSSFRSTGAIKYMLDITPSAITNHSIGLTVRLAIPAVDGRGQCATSSTRTIASGKRVLIIGLTPSADPAIRGRVQTGEIVTGRGPYTAYYVEVKLVPGPIPPNPARPVRPASYDADTNP